MRLENINICPSKESIIPEIMFGIEILYQHERQIPLSVFGNIFSVDKKKAATINQKLRFKLKSL